MGELPEQDTHTVFRGPDQTADYLEDDTAVEPKTVVRPRINRPMLSPGVQRIKRVRKFCSWLLDVVEQARAGG